MYVLKDLWRGSLSPMERTVRPGSDYNRVSLEICEQIDRFLEALTSEEKKQWETISGLRNDMTLMGEEDAFIYGFRMGARMIIDVVGDYKGPFEAETP